MAYFDGSSLEKVFPLSCECMPNLVHLNLHLYIFNSCNLNVLQFSFHTCCLYGDTKLDKLQPYGAQCTVKSSALTFCLLFTPTAMWLIFVFHGIWKCVIMTETSLDKHNRLHNCYSLG